jgi:hypothetical protein
MSRFSGDTAITANGLLGSTTLEVAIGLIFVYLLLAIICTTVNEWIAGILKTRSTTLRSAIQQLLDGQGDRQIRAMRIGSSSSSTPIP